AGSARRSGRSGARREHADRRSRHPARTGRPRPRARAQPVRHRQDGGPGERPLPPGAGRAGAPQAASPEVPGMTGTARTKPALGSLFRKAVLDLRRPSFPVDATTPSGGVPTGSPDRYPIDLRPMTAGTVLDDEGLVVTRSTTGLTYRNPVSISLYALGRH